MTRIKRRHQHALFLCHTQLFPFHTQLFTHTLLQGNIFVIHLEPKDAEIYVGFNWLRIALLGCVCEK